ncbi:hypothetical protein MRX96_040580 [Rhipicephalus microplus]
MSWLVGSDDDGGEVVTRSAARGCRQQALKTGPGVAGKKRLVDSQPSRRTSAPAGGPAASVGGQRLLWWYSRAEEPGRPGYSDDRATRRRGDLPGRPPPREGPFLVFWL